jgi:streptogramin lyase
VKKLLVALFALCPLVSFAQVIFTSSAIVNPLSPHDTNDLKDQVTFANGPRLVPRNGGIWFLESNADRIAFVQNDTIKEWPIRSRSYDNPYRSIGANPADFEVDGSVIWFIENGSSGIELQQSVFGKLDTVTNEMTEWILPVSKPAGFVREPDGTVWIAMSQGSLIHLDLQTNRVTAYRGPNSFAYSGIVAGTDGNLYLSDFGSNRIVRFNPVTLNEVAWQELDPNFGRTELSQPTLDGAGHVFVAEEISGGAIARLDLSTGEWDRFGNGFLLDPTHFFLQGNFVYAVETDPSGGDGRFVVVDLSTVAFAKISSSPVLNNLNSLLLTPATVRTTTLVPLTFQSSDKPPDGTIAPSKPATGISRFTLPSGNLLPTSTSFSIAPIEGKVVAGVRGALVEFTLLPSGNSTDLVVPLAFNAANGLVRTDFVLFDAKAPSGDVVAEFFSSPVPPPPTKSYRVGATTTLTVANALGSAELNAGDAVGSVLFTPHVGDTGNYQAATRSYAVLADGGTYGFALPAQEVSTGLTGASGRTLFLATQPGETSIFGTYSPTGATGTGTLRGPDGSVRGSYPFFLPENNRQEFNPAFSAFGVTPEAGDTITFDVTSGTIFPYSTFFETTGDAAVVTPSTPGSAFVAPMAGSAPTSAGKVVTEILLANPDTNVAASVNLAFFPSGGGAVTETTATVPAGGSAVVPYEDPALGFGALLVKASSAVSAVARFANRTPGGDYAAAVPLLSAPSPRGRFLVSSDTRLRRNVFVFNRGTAGTISIKTFSAGGSVLGVQELPVGDHRSLILPNVGASMGTSGGRVEFSGSEGTALYVWLASTDVVTGDSDAESPFPVTP